MTTYKIKRGDTLWGIAKALLGDPYRWVDIADLNNISRSKPIIYEGKDLKIPESTSSTKTSKNTGNVVTLQYFGLEAGTDSIFVTWKWDKEHTENYRVRWSYYNGVNPNWFLGNDSTTEEKLSKYTPPSNAVKVKVTVKPIAKTHKVNKNDTAWWTADWCKSEVYDLKNNPPDTPSAPSVKIEYPNTGVAKPNEKCSLVATLTGLENLKVDSVWFEIVRNNTKVIWKGSSKINTGLAEISYRVEVGSEYKVRCRLVRGTDNFSEWSPYSSNVATKPLPPDKGIRTCRLESVDDNSGNVYLSWQSVIGADTYNIEYVTDVNYFDKSGEAKTVTGINSTQWILRGLPLGKQYFFRVQSAKGSDTSSWSTPVSIVIGTTPQPPTTWSSTNTGMVGEKVTLHWVHNSEDNSAQTHAAIEMYVNDVKETHWIDTPGGEPDEKTMYYDIDTSRYSEGSKIRWRVCTAGITEEYGGYSIEREIDIYAKPEIDITVNDADGNYATEIDSLPIYILGETSPQTQTPISYHISVIAKGSYETVDNVGNPIVISDGSEIYSKIIDTNEQLSMMLSANEISLENNMSYTIVCTATMNSGLDAEAAFDITVAWEGENYVPSAELGLNKERVYMQIRPYLVDEENILVKETYLSVYRREFDGRFTLIANNLGNIFNHRYVIDPHPSLDYARYRIIATNAKTGKITYSDLPGYPVQDKNIIIQWDDDWVDFETSEETELEEQPWAGSMLRLPYNINVSEKASPDSSFVNYIGRNHPVSYYGTHFGETSSWSTDIPKSDKETLYALRRLSKWMGDVYVREPSGLGYWASIKVSFSQTHAQLTIPVTLDITRVEGGA